MRFRKYKTYLINSGLILTSTLLAFAVTEFVLGMTQLAIPDRMETSSISGLVTQSYPDFYRFVPGMEATIVSRTCEFLRQYKINSLGMLDQEHPREEDRKRKRILFIGDSFTEGVGVGDSQPYPQWLQTYSDGQWECLNAGMRGTSPSHAYFRLKRYINQSLEFDFVAFQFFNNDFNDDQIFTKQFGLQVSKNQTKITRKPFHRCYGKKLHYLGPLAYPFSQTQWFMLLGRFFAEGHTIKPYKLTTSPSKANTILQLFEHSGIRGIQTKTVDDKKQLIFPIVPEKTLLPEDRDQLWRFWKRPSIKTSVIDHYNEKVKNLHKLQPTKSSALTMKYLHCLKALCERNKIPFAIYAAPVTKQSSITFPMYLQKWCQENDVPFFCPFETLVRESVASQEAMYHSFDGHMAPKGHRIVAKEMLHWLHAIFDKQSKPVVKE